MMDFNLDLNLVKEESLTLVSTKELNLASLFNQVSKKTSSFLTPISLPRYLDFLTEDGKIVVVENFED